MAKPKKSSLISSSTENPVAAKAAIQTTTTVFHHSGPLPDPRTLEYYERVYPGAAREIIEMAKGEQADRHRDTFRNWLAHLLGQIFAFVLGMTGLCGGVLLLYVGKSLTGLGVFIASLGTLIGAAIWEKKQKSKPAVSNPPDSN